VTTFVLIPGAGGAAVHWAGTVTELASRGHLGIAVDIREDDPALGLPEYAEIVDAAIGDHPGVVLVAHSLGGFTAPMIAKRDRVERIVLLNAMIPLPGETPGQWWGAVGSAEAMRAAAEAGGYGHDFDLETYFLHDLPEAAKVSMTAEDREPADTPFGQPCTFERWPDVPIHVLVGADDRMFPAEFQVRVARERLGVRADVMPGGHLTAMSRPAEVADRLIAYARS
jgi:pimeloyl-ACP methyl ester carboxylesterase